MVISRPEGWDMRLSAYLQENRSTPFQWGVKDCVMFAAKGLEAVSGVNMYAEYEGYATKEQAEEIITANGGISELVSKHLGPGHRNFKQAKRGDLVLMKMPELTIGIVDDSGQRIAALTLKDGLVRLPLTKAWRVWSY